VIYAFDTEFIDDGAQFQLVSIGVARDDGGTLYVESLEVDWMLADSWVIEHVRPQLEGNAIPRAEMRERLVEFIGDDTPTFFAYYAPSDWVNLFRLFGTLLDLPSGWPRLCFDLKQWQVALGMPALPPDPAGAHKAIDDAVWNLEVYRLLAALDPTGAERMRILS